jgi:hypothetical protein
MDQQLPTQMLPAVPHVAFSIFNFAIPTIIAIAVVIVAFFLGAWARIPRWIAGGHEAVDPGETPPLERTDRS